MILAIDLGGTQIKSGLVNSDFELQQQFEAVDSPDNLEDCLKIFDDIILPQLDAIEGIAISAPGTIDTEQGVIYNGGMLRFLHEFAVREQLENRYNKPVVALNDGKAAALAELASGNLKGAKNALALVLGTGLGGGIIINGQLYQGSHYQAGELTFALPPQTAPHQMEDMAGAGCSAVGFIERVNRQLGMEDLHNGLVAFEAINRHDEQVFPLFQDYCRQVAHQVLNLQAALDVEKVVIGGGISGQPILIDEINKQYDQLREEVEPVKFVLYRPEIAVCHHHNGANLIGAAYFFSQMNKG